MSTGRSNKLGPVLTRAEVDENLKTYTAQAARVLDMDKTEVRQNAEWFDKMNFEELLKLTTRMTVAQMVERDTFQTRMESGEPIGINEFLYPLMQGWDSVMVKADLELGGTDQLFNLLVGRRLQEQESQRPQIVMTQPLINGVDGRKMSKSYGNAVGLMASAKEMTFKIMQVDDDVMPTWFLHLTRLSQGEIDAALAGHPREAKARLAAEVATFYHGAEKAAEAAEMFNREVRDKVLPDDIPEVRWNAAWGAELALPNFLKEAGMCQSTSEARRAIQQGGVRLDGEVAGDVAFAVTQPSAEVLVQVGKKRVKRLVP